MAWSAVSPAWTLIPDGGMRTGVAPLTATALEAVAAEISETMDGAAIAGGAQCAIATDREMRDARRRVLIAFRMAVGCYFIGPQ